MVNMTQIVDEIELRHMCDLLGSLEKSENSFDYPFEIVTEYESYPVYYSTERETFLMDDKEDAEEAMSVSDMAEMIADDYRFAVYGPRELYFDSMVDGYVTV